MTILYIIGSVVMALILWRTGLMVWQKTADVYHYCQNLKLDRLSRAQALAEPSRIAPDPMTGSYPLLQEPGGAGRVLDIDRGLIFDRNGLVSASPEVHRWAARRRIVQSLTVNVPGADPVAGLLAEPERPIQWPTEIPLKSVVTEPDIGALALGVTVSDDGRQEIVKADMGKLVHIAVGGSSGWGKSVFLRSLAYQLALSQTPVDLAMIDLEGATLAPFARCGRLLFPVADTETDALAVLKALLDEMERRKGLYARFPGVDSLAAYNARADEPLIPIVLVADEATALLTDKSVESALRTLTLRARKYGVWCVLSGQDWKASSLDTAIRNQLSSRVQFKAMSKSQSRVLLEQSGAEDLDVVGRALAVLPGRELFTMQAPNISARTILADCSDGGPRYVMPEGNGQDSALTKRVWALHREGLGLGAIAEAIYGYRNARKTGEIKAILGLD